MSEISEAKLMNPQVWDRKLFLGGWVNSHQVAEVTDKATGEVLAHAGVASAEDVSKACEPVAKAAPAWAATPTKVRAAIVRRAGELIRDKMGHLGYAAPNSPLLEVNS